MEREAILSDYDGSKIAEMRQAEESDVLAAVITNLQRSETTTLIQIELSDLAECIISDDDGFREGAEIINIREAGYRHGCFHSNIRPSG